MVTPIVKKHEVSEDFYLIEILRPLEMSDIVIVDSPYLGNVREHAEKQWKSYSRHSAEMKISATVSAAVGSHFMDELGEKAAQALISVTYQTQGTYLSVNYQGVRSDRQLDKLIKVWEECETHYLETRDTEIGILLNELNRKMRQHVEAREAIFDKLLYTAVIRQQFDAPDYLDNLMREMASLSYHRASTEEKETRARMLKAREDFLAARKQLFDLRRSVIEGELRKHGPLVEARIEALRQSQPEEPKSFSFGTGGGS